MSGWNGLLLSAGKAIGNVCADYPGCRELFNVRTLNTAIEAVKEESFAVHPRISRRSGSHFGGKSADFLGKSSSCVKQSGISTQSESPPVNQSADLGKKLPPFVKQFGEDGRKKSPCVKQSADFGQKKSPCVKHSGNYGRRKGHFEE